MKHAVLQDPALTIALAAAAGMLDIDSNQAACAAAEAEGFRMLHDGGLEPDVQERAELDIRAGCLGLTSNEEVNLLFASRCRLFGEPEEIVAWMRRLESGEARVEPWGKPPAPPSEIRLPELDGLFLPLVVQRGKRAFPLDEGVILRPGDLLHAAVVEERRQEVAARLRQVGWEWASSASIEARM